MSNEVLTKAKMAKEASFRLANISTDTKDRALAGMAKALRNSAKDILDANSVDLEAGQKKNMSRALIDRLALDGKRIDQMIEGIELVVVPPRPRRKDDRKVDAGPTGLR